jgi:hypothetical protein
VKSLLLSIIICCCLFPYCNNNDTTAGNQEKDTLPYQLSKKQIDALKKRSEQPPLCIVYCDFTNSVDSTSASLIIKNAEEIFNRLYDSYKLTFYIISKNDWSIPFFETDLLLIKNPRPSERIQLNQLLKIEKPASLDSFQKVLNRVVSQKRIKPSCIVNAVENSIRVFDNYDKTGQLKLRLILLSDMIEYCKSSIGLIDLENKHYKEANKLVDDFKDTTYSFSKFKNLQIDIIVSSQKDNAASDQNKLWKKIFQKYGYVNLPNLSSTSPRY